MMTRKDRKIANQEVKIKNRDKLIEDQQKKIAKLETRLIQIRALTECNNYNYPEVFLHKIKELTDCESN